MRVLFWAMILLIAAWTDFRIMITFKPKPLNPKPMLLSLIRGVCASVTWQPALEAVWLASSPGTM